MDSIPCILSGVYDDRYLGGRDDSPAICTSAGKRLKLYAAIAEATGTVPLILSPQPKGLVPRSTALPAASGRFGNLEQRFCRTSRRPKVRILFNFFYYAFHVNRHAPANSLFIVDNYELIYILALRLRLLLGKPCRVVMEYEDGKHAIDKGFHRLLSSLAEKLGRPLMLGGILATPSLAARLPGVPWICVPGVLQEVIRPWVAPAPDEPVQFIYSGSLDDERGLPLLLDYLDSTLPPPDVIFHITGQGRYAARCREVAEKHPDRVVFHGTVDEKELARLRSECHYGLNLQRSGNPISDVTFPSKTFDYLNAGLRVISTRAAGVDVILGGAAKYLEGETADDLSRCIVEACAQARRGGPAEHSCTVLGEYTWEGTIRRLRELFRGLPA